MTATLSSYQTISKDLTRWQSITAKSPAVALQNKYFLANIGNVKTIDDLVNNRRLFSFAMTAFGLGDRLDAKGLMRKVLEQGVSSSTALANKLNDPRVKAFATTFDFATNGAATTASASTMQSVVDKYVEQSLETTQSQQNPGVEMALYFSQNAPKVTSMYGILADRKMLTVVQTALGISPLTSMENIDTQARLLSTKLNIADLQDPKKLQAFIGRFCAMYDASNTDPNGGGSSSAPNALLYQAGSSSIATDLLMTVQNLKLGG